MNIYIIIIIIIIITIIIIIYDDYIIYIYKYNSKSLHISPDQSPFRKKVSLKNNGWRLC